MDVDVYHLRGRVGCERDLEVQDEDRAAESVEGEWCRRQAVVHHEVHVEQHQTVDPDADWKGSDQSKYDIEHDARSIATCE